MNCHETCIGLLVVHMLDTLEECEFEPWLPMSSPFPEFDASPSDTFLLPNSS